MTTIQDVLRKEKNVLYRDTGLRAKAVRERLKMTLDTMSKTSGVSRSYLSDFERGYKVPTSKYLIYLHNHHNVDVNYILGSEERMFRPEPDKDVKPEFGKFSEEVDEMIRFMASLPHALYAVLGYFTQYKTENRKLIKEFVQEMAEKAKEKE
ncbi:MAG: helix-turn-helix transcriptional regulator [bacterium]|nr:helix-turn-helix transcriptional regulator [bacterium]